MDKEKEKKTNPEPSRGTEPEREEEGEFCTKPFDPENARGLDKDDPCRDGTR